MRMILPQLPQFEPGTLMTTTAVDILPHTAVDIVDTAVDILPLRMDTMDILPLRMAMPPNMNLGPPTYHRFAEVQTMKLCDMVTH